MSHAQTYTRNEYTAAVRRAETAESANAGLERQLLAANDHCQRLHREIFCLREIISQCVDAMRAALGPQDVPDTSDVTLLGLSDLGISGLSLEDDGKDSTELFGQIKHVHSLLESAIKSAEEALK
jgi:hypothetical protein